MRIFTFTGIILILLIFTLAYKYDHQQPKLELHELQAFSNTVVSKKNQPLEIVEKDLYEKLRLGSPINYLVLGDSIGESDGAENENERWYLGLTSQIQKFFKGNVIHDINGTPGGTIFGGWIDYLTLQKSNKDFDMVILCFGQNDQTAMELEIFQANYEALVRKIKIDYPKAEIVTLIESSLSKEEYVESINEISEYYNLLVVDTRAAFRASGKPYNTLTNDGTHPNSAGYRLYTKSIFEAIQSKVQTTVVTTIPSDLLFADTKIFQTGQRLTNWENLNGFELTREGGILGKAGASAELSFTGELLGIEKWADVTGGDYEVYVDSQLIKKFDNRAPFRVNWESLISYNLGTGEHKVVIKIPDDSPANAIVNISSIISN
ncbi:SGNH/GDSL hydrolase family protein [Cohnella lupini]|uniref:Lysophospholipase L1-like esterase n=1 Tax=Cohnella lupini TaxID=1294267 RepID=A0A3D9HZC8_9BACL|nr:SGNH/GDSL hydrolase family protein [Cohnella lupini]RED54739.1 lysophospholipase L1-like esterase [Cohnella lupini]